MFGGLGAGLNEIMTQGGVVASFTTTTMMGHTTANGVWDDRDFEMADQVLACGSTRPASPYAAALPAYCKIVR